MFDNIILAFGPFVGSFQTEIEIFRPYTRWITEAIKPWKTYISVHSNRSFLYEWIDEIIPVYENLSRDELSQVELIHEKLSREDFNMIQKLFEKSIPKESHIIKSFSLSYSKSSKTHYSIFNKLYERLEVPDVKTYMPENKYIAFIPDKKEDLCKLEFLYGDLKDEYNIIVIGDMKTHLESSNIILRKIDYFENGYKYIMKYLSNAEAVLCPTGHWNLISNLQGIPTFSWGKDLTLYREGGILNFGNFCTSIFSDENTSPQVISENFKYFYKKIKEMK